MNQKTKSLLPQLALTKSAMNLVVIAAVGACAGCAVSAGDEGSAGDEEEVSAEQLPIGEVACKFANADGRINGSGTINIQRGYNNPGCEKAYVTDLDNIQGGGGRSVWLKFNDTLPVNQDVCTTVGMRMDLYKWGVSSGSYELRQSRSVRGRWQNNRCLMDTIAVSLSETGHYRTATQAVRRVTGQPTYAMTHSVLKLSFP